MWKGHELFLSSFPKLIQYMPMTLLCFIAPTLAAAVLGTVICIIRVGKKTPLYYITSLFVSFFRGTPGLVQIYLFFFGLPRLLEVFGIDINNWQAAAFYIMATCCNFSSFVSESLRGAYGAVDKLQIEAGYSIGYNRAQCFWRVIVPQTLEIALPNLKNLEIDLLKGSAVAYVIGATDIMGSAQYIISQHRGYGQIWVLLAAAVLYFIINVFIEVAFNGFTRLCSRHERAVSRT